MTQGIMVWNFEQGADIFDLLNQSVGNEDLCLVWPTGYPCFGSSWSFGPVQAQSEHWDD